MAGNKEGGRKAAAVNKEKHGADFYKRIGRMGGSKSHPETRPFTKNPELARIAGQKGGKKSSRAGIKNKKPRVVKETKKSPVEEKKGILGWFSGRRSQ